MIKAINYAAGTTLALLVLFLALDYTFSMPVVYTSYSTDECVKVDNYPGVIFNSAVTYSCENMPAKYTHEWAE